MFVADFTRGVDVIKVGGLARRVTAPALAVRSLPNLPSTQLGWLCQVPKALGRPDLVDARLRP